MLIYRKLKKKDSEEQAPLKASYWNNFFEKQLSDKTNSLFEMSQIDAASKINIVTILKHFPI